jgi:hypothetical protein
MRLYPDMFPLVRQLRAVTDHAISATARLAGAELNVIKFVDDFQPRFSKLGADNKALHAEMTASERYKKAQEKILAR